MTGGLASQHQSRVTVLLVDDQALEEDPGIARMDFLSSCDPKPCISCVHTCTWTLLRRGRRQEAASLACIRNCEAASARLAAVVCLYWRKGLAAPMELAA